MFKKLFASLKTQRKPKLLSAYISMREYDFFRKKAEEKIRSEKWEGRNIPLKINNFVNCWVTEEAFKKVLMERNIWFRHRGMYVGDAEGSTDDFQVKLDGQVIGVGLRSINEDSLKKWKSVAYPDDRFRLEKEKIGDYTIACYYEEGDVQFLGIISKKELLDGLEKAERRYSPRNQEHFRTVSLEKFRYGELLKFLGGLEKV